MQISIMQELAERTAFQAMARSYCYKGEIQYEVQVVRRGLF